MKILLINAYDRSSKGDAMLLSQSIKLLTKAFPGARIMISSMEDTARFARFEGHKNLGSFRLDGDAPHLIKPLRILYKAYLIMSSLLWARLNASPARGTRADWVLPKRLRALCRQHRSSDLVVSVAGGYLNASSGLSGDLNVLFMMHAIRFATYLKKPTILLNQTVGPFGSKLQRRIAHWGLSDVLLIITREKISYDLLMSLGIPRQKVHASIDLGFLAGQNQSPSPRLKKPTVKKVGITASVRLLSKPQKHYEQALSNFMNQESASRGLQFVGLPQSTSTYQNDGDQAIYARLLNRSKNSSFTIDDRDLDHHQIISEYATCDLTIGTRFHSVIFSLINYVPSIAIEYDYKTTGIMLDLGLEKWVIKVQDVTLPLMSEMFENLLSEYSDYIKTLQEVLPDYISRAALLPKLLNDTYNLRPQQH